MGFDVQGIKFLMGAHRSGVSFTRTATLGRQELFISASHLRKILHGFGFPSSDAEARRLAPESGGFAEPLLRWLGGEDIISIDASWYEGASVVHDMNLPIPETLRGAFSLVIDGGTLEHVFNYPVAIKNCMEMLQVGGHLLLMTPANNFMGHGFYQFSPELFFRIFSDQNGFEINRVIFTETVPAAQWYKVVDPARAGRRVEMINTRPAYLLIQARKLRQVPVLASAPQQSDYTVLWQDPGTKRDESRIAQEGAAHILRGIARRVKAAYRNLRPAGRRPQLDGEVFIKVDWHE